MRCSTLAGRLVDHGATVHLLCSFEEEFPDWVCSSFPGEMHSLPVGMGGHAGAGEASHQGTWSAASQDDDASHCLDLMSGTIGSEHVGCVVVDHYGLDSRWHQLIRPSCAMLFAIDDLGDRDMEVDVLLDQNRSEEAATALYSKRVKNDCRILAGPSWSLVRDQFSSTGKRNARSLGENPPRILILMGGSDPDSLTARVLATLAAFPRELEITVVIGESGQLERLQNLASSMSHVVDIRVAERDMAGLMSRTDVAISAAGSTVWELCCMGVPMILFAKEVNQFGVIQQAEMAGAAVRLTDFGAEALHAVLGTMIGEGDLLNSMSRAGQRLVDGQGALRVSEVILKS
ncbi:MAG: UDP-2,4-diacetamido-2,4,6-trideoxy-beta-L-altropyranose hydrolase [Phycisphaerales bacterium]|nr:UDP-2,4-diacetamido-2,4,6-trideoxy-beta-L-altropyranose hydrolase [Phycisphaerales bacterium]